MQVAQKLKISLPPPHARQREIENCGKKRVIVNAGRRAGKTFMVARKAIKKAGRGLRVLYAAPITSQTDRFWELCTEWLADAIRAGIVHENKTKRILTFPGGGKIVAKTAFRPDHLRGDFADFLILDEYAYQNPDTWEKVAMPMLLDNDGDAWFISTPDKRNHFYIMYLKAKKDKSGRWSVFTFPSTENPHLSKSALAELTEDMLEDDYKQEILALFVKGYGQVFKLHVEDFVPPKEFEDLAFIHAGHRLVAGLDWGRKNDYTCMCIGCATCRIELEIERFAEIDYPTQRDRIRGICERYRTAGDEDPPESDKYPAGFELEIRGESNAMGLPVIEQLREDGIAVLEFYADRSSKPTIVQQIRLAFEKRTWKWLDDPDAFQELETYESKVSSFGNIQFGAPEGLHDDTVTARMLMLHQSIMGTFTLA